MSDFLPVERAEFASFGPLTAIDITENSVIVLELRDWQLSAADTMLLRQRCQSVFPNNPVMVVDPKKLGVRVMDQPEELVAANLRHDRVRAVWTAVSVATLVIQLIRTLRRRHR